MRDQVLRRHAPRVVMLTLDDKNQPQDFAAFPLFSTPFSWRLWLIGALRMVSRPPCSVSIRHRDDVAIRLHKLLSARHHDLFEHGNLFDP